MFNESECNDGVQQALKAIPADIDAIRFPDLLQPVLQELAELEPAKAEAYLQHSIRPCFRLKSSEFTAYRATIAQMRRDRVALERDEHFEGQTERSSDLFKARFPGLMDVVENDNQLVFALVKVRRLESMESVQIGDNELTSDFDFTNAAPYEFTLAIAAGGRRSKP